MARRRGCATADSQAEPISAINTTPLIDLMLVLLIMFILAVPVATHKVPLDLPVGDPAPVRQPPIVHLLSLDPAGRLTWNGRPVGDRQLPALLARVAADPGDPELHLSVDSETRYERVDLILATIRRAGVGRLGFVGNERFARALDGRSGPPA